VGRHGVLGPCFVLYLSFAVAQFGAAAAEGVGASMPQYRPHAWIVTIGNELLIGRVVNTNAAWLAGRFTLHGIKVERMLTVPDSLNDIAEAIGQAVRRADIVVTTGGLGPTPDDMTMEAVAAALHRPLVLNPTALRMVEEFYRSRGYEVTPEARKMALLPYGAEPIPNSVGAAPGAWIIEGRTHVFVLPGVPREMEAMMDYVLDRLRPILPKLCLREAAVIVKGVPEAKLAPLLRRAARLCPRCYTKSHPKGHEADNPVVEVRVLAAAEECEMAEESARMVISELKKHLGGNIAAEK